MVWREDDSALYADTEPLATEAWCLCLFHVLMRHKGGMIVLRVFIKEYPQQEE